MEHPNYSFKNIIGQGGMATVYLAEHNTLHQDVAIKVLNKEFVHNENIRKRFLAEARNMFKMSHPNIIKVTDLIDQDDLVAFVMEYMEGQTLKEYLDKKGKLPDVEIKQLFVQMLDAVGYVHEQGLIHRDIKPSNFMISGKGVVKLLDFGIAKNTDVSSTEYTLTGTAQNMGTPMYMSPEQVKSTKDVTSQSDIYSLGVVLWQMVMGRKPYDSNTLSTFELQTKIVTEKLAETNSVFEKVIGKATIKDLVARYISCSSMKEDLVNGQTHTTQTKKKKVKTIQAEQTIIESSLIEETKIETAPPKKVNYAVNDVDNVKTDKAEPINSKGNQNKVLYTPLSKPQKSSSKLALWLSVFFITIIIGIALIVSDSSTGYTESTQLDEFEDISTPPQSEAKSVTFTNNSRIDVSIAIAFYGGNSWTSKGWYNVASGASYTYNLGYYPYEEIYFHIRNDVLDHFWKEGASFCIDKDNAFEFNNVDCYNSKAGFYALTLTGDNTYQSLIK
jgi:serine/threonine protein kinase